MSIRARSERVIPNCRYGHGDLKKVDITYPDSDMPVRFSWISSLSVSMQFVGSIYTCRTCGYAEFFDDDPEFTAEHEGEFK